MKRTTILWAVMAMVFGLTGSAQAVTVCQDGSCDETSIGAALNDSKYAGQDVIVGPGTYFESGLLVVDRSLISTIPNLPELTIIDATGTDQDVIRGAANATIIGFTIRGGRVGIRSRGTVGENTVVLQNLIIEDNKDDEDSSLGGGVDASHGTWEIINCTIQNNRGLIGAGISFYSPGSQLTIRGGTIQGNDAVGSPGGGISLDPVSSMVIEDTVITGNSAGSGAGMAIWGTTVLHNVQVLNNIASGNGGGIFKMQLMKTPPTFSSQAVLLTATRRIEAAVFT